MNMKASASYYGRKQAKTPDLFHDGSSSSKRKKKSGSVQRAHSPLPMTPTKAKAT